MQCCSYLFISLTPPGTRHAYYLLPVIRVIQVFLRGLDVPVHRPLLHAGIRQFLHRMVVCLDTAVLPFVPLAMENLLKSADARELHDFIPLINQVVIKFKVRVLCLSWKHCTCISCRGVPSCAAPEDAPSCSICSVEVYITCRPVPSCALWSLGLCNTE